MGIPAAPERRAVDVQDDIEAACRERRERPNTWERREDPSVQRPVAAGLEQAPVRGAGAVDLEVERPDLLPTHDDPLVVGLDDEVKEEAILVLRFVLVGDPAGVGFPVVVFDLGSRETRPAVLNVPLEDSKVVGDVLAETLVLL
jgi:hypothetical protein